MCARNVSLPFKMFPMTPMTCKTVPGLVSSPKSKSEQCTYGMSLVPGGVRVHVKVKKAMAVYVRVGKLSLLSYFLLFYPLFGSVLILEENARLRHLQLLRMYYIVALP